MNERYLTDAEGKRVAVVLDMVTWERILEDLEDLEDILEGLDCVSEVRAEPTGNVVAVSFEGGRDEQEEIEHAIEGAGYEVSRLSVRTDFPEE